MLEFQKNKFIHGNSVRLFLNTELGCASSCSYCYLPSEGFPVNASPSETTQTTAKEILEYLSSDPRVITGEDGTIFSIGCFSECWDARNKSETISLIVGLLSFGNPIQLATKRKINFSDLELITNSPCWKNQLKIYISSATISSWHSHEKGTTRPDIRFKSFEACKQADIESFLYIKPVLPGLTIKDAAAYAALMDKYGIAAVVGDQFFENSEKITGSKSPISLNLTVAPINEAKELRDFLRSYGKVYENSTETVKIKAPS